MIRGPRVVVAGAGVAGLCAAHRLVGGGLSPTLLEAGDRVGGRLETLCREGFTADLGAQVLYSSYRETLGLCRRLGLGDRLSRLRTRARILHRGRLRTQLHFLDSWPKRWATARLHLRLLLGRHRSSSPRWPGPPELDGVDFESWVRFRFGQALLEELFEPFVAAVVHDRSRRLSAACGLSYLRWATGRTYALQGGMTTLTRRLARDLPAIRLGRPVARVVVEKDRLRGVQVGPDPGDFVACDGLVLAVPAHAVARVVPSLPDAEREWLRSVSYSSSVHAVLALPRPATRGIYAVLSAAGAGRRTSCLLEDAARGAPAAPPGRGLVHAFLTGPHADWAMRRSDEEIVRTVLSDLREASAEVPAACDFAWVRRWTDSVCLWGVGHAAAVASLLERVRTIRGLYLCGDYAGIPSVEGAVGSGLDAARELLADVAAGRIGTGAGGD